MPSAQADQRPASFVVAGRGELGLVVGVDRGRVMVLFATAASGS